MRSRPSWTSGVTPILRIHLRISLIFAALRRWVALSDELPAHSLDVSSALFACSWHCSYLSRLLGSRSLAVLLSSRPFGTCFIKQLSTSHSEPRLPIHGWIQLNFDVCEVTCFRNTRRNFVRIFHAQPGCLQLCRCTESVALPQCCWHQTSTRQSLASFVATQVDTRTVSGTLDVTPFLHESDFTIFADTSLTHSFHTPQSPISVHATCLHLVRRTQALRPPSSRTPSSTQTRASP